MFYRQLFLFCFVIIIYGLVPMHVKSQTLTESPYSRFGIGDVQSHALGLSRAMGGVSYALNTPDYINFSNPASYSSFRQQSFIFETGVLSNTVKRSAEDIKQTVNNSLLSYLVFGFPVTKWWGSSLGLRPFSSVGYSIEDTQKYDETEQVDFAYEGKGGINQFYFGNGFAWKGISLGVNASYLFGTISNIRTEEFSQANTMHLLVDKSTTIGDIYFDYGMRYTYKTDTLLKKTIKGGFAFTAGLVFSHDNQIKAEQKLFAFTYKTPKIYVIKDTVQIDTLSGNIKLPLSVGFGISAKLGEKWLFAADYSMRRWSDYTAFGLNDSLVNSMSVSVGMQYTPDFEGGFFKSIRYRFGMRIEKTNLKLNGMQLPEYAISFGVGVPMRKSRSTINLSFEAGQRGASALIKEDFVRIHLDFTLGDVWFLKRKYD